MKRLLFAGTFGVVLVATGCSGMSKNSSSDSSNSGSGSTSSAKSNGIAQGATIGALSGAALGGGIGAIVGSTSGHLGEGVAVGALAGGVAGAGIGAAAGDYNAKQAARMDSARDQNRQMKEQRKELDSVKDSLGDDISYRGPNKAGTPYASSAHSTGAHHSNTYAVGSSAMNTASMGATGAYGIRENYHGNPNAKPYRTAAGTAIPASVMQSNSRARLAESSSAGRSTSGAKRVDWASEREPAKTSMMAKNTEAVSPSYKGGAYKEASYKEKIAPALPSQGTVKKGITEEMPAADELDEPPVRTVDKATGTVKNAPATMAKKASGDLPAAKQATDSVGTTDDVKGAVVAKQLGKVPADASSACIQAEKEAARATNASSDADRLFYLGRASRLCPTSDTYQVELGKVFAKIGKTQEASSAFKKAAELNPQNDVAHDELSILENSGQ